jgi:hypothetical protein
MFIRNVRICSQKESAVSWTMYIYLEIMNHKYSLQAIADFRSTVRGIK